MGDSRERRKKIPLLGSYSRSSRAHLRGWRGVQEGAKKKRKKKKFGRGRAGEAGYTPFNTTLDNSSRVEARRAADTSAYSPSLLRRRSAEQAAATEATLQPAAILNGRLPGPPKLSQKLFPILPPSAMARVKDRPQVSFSLADRDFLLRY